MTSARFSPTAAAPSLVDTRHRVEVRPSHAVRDADVGLTADLECARAGDEAAFSRVFRAVQPGLLRYLAVLVGADNDDVASEAWSHVCRDLAGFRGDFDGFRAWVATIGRHRAIDHLRARGRRPVDMVPVEDLHGHAAADTTDGRVFEKLSTAEALAVIATLPRDQAEAVLLRAVMGLDAASAGRVLGKRAGAVRTAAYRGLKTLARQLTDAAETEESRLTSRRCDISGPVDADEVR